MGRRTKERGRVQDAFRDYPELDEDNIVRATIDPKEARRMFEQGTLHQNDLNSAGRASQELRPTSPNRLDDTRQRYLEQTTAPAPVPVAGKDRKSLKKRKKFGRKKKVSSSPSSSGSNSDADSDEISWDDLIDSRYTPLIIDLADWLGYITGRKVPWEKFFDKLWSGVLLCDFCNSMNKLCNDPALEPINMSTHTDRGRTFVRYNVEVYIIWCRKFGIPELSLMDVSDLVDKKSVKMVLGTILAVGREARARALPCPVVAVLEQTYKMNYESMIDAVVGEDAIDDSKDIHDSVKLKRKRFQMIKAKALSGANIRQGTLDDDKRNIQEDILCLMYLKGFKKGDESAESVIKGWQGAVRNGDYRSATLPSNLKAKLDQFEGVDLRYGQTLPRNYGGAKSPSNLEGSEEDEARRGAEIEELRNFKTPDLSQFEDQEKEIETKRGDKTERRISFGFGLSDIFGSKEKEEKSGVNVEKKDELVIAIDDEVGEPQTAEYVLTIPGEQFNQMRESGILGDMLENYVITDDGEYNVVLTGEQYGQFQALINQDTRLETVSQAQDGYYIVLFTPAQWDQIHQYKEITDLDLTYDQSSDHDKFVVKMSEKKYDRYLEIQTTINDMAEEKTKKRDSKKKVKKSKSKDGDADAASPNATPKSKRKSRSKLGRWGSKSSIKHAETSESEGDPTEKKVRRTKSFSFNKKKKDGSASEDGERKRRSSLFGRKKKKSEPPPPPPPEPTPVVQPEPEPEPEQFGVWPNIQTRLGEADDPSLSLANESRISDEKTKLSSSESREERQKVDPKTRIPPHLDYRTMETDDRNRRTKIEPEVLGPDYRAADDPGYYKEDNVSNDEVTYTDVSEYSIVDYPIIGKRKRKKKRRRKRGMPTSGGAYRTEVGCFECFVMIFCPWRWVSSR